MRGVGSQPVSPEIGRVVVGTKDSELTCANQQRRGRCMPQRTSKIRQILHDAVVEAIHGMWQRSNRREHMVKRTMKEEESGRVVEGASDR